MAKNINSATVITMIAIFCTLKGITPKEKIKANNVILSGNCRYLISTMNDVANNDTTKAKSINDKPSSCPKYILLIKIEILEIIDKVNTMQISFFDKV